LLPQEEGYLIALVPVQSYRDTNSFTLPFDAIVYLFDKAFMLLFGKMMMAK